MTEPLVETSEFAKDDYGIKGATATSMTRYGYALLAIAGADGTVRPEEMQWLVRHQRKFGAPQSVIDEYESFDYRSADLPALVGAIATDVPTWQAAPHLVYHAIQMCSADREYGPAERAKVRAAAQQMGVAKDIVLTLEALVAMEGAATDMRKALFHIETD